MASRRPGRYLETFLEPAASLWLSMSPWRATATPFVPKMINMFADFWKRHTPSHVLFNIFSKNVPTVPLSLGLTHPKRCSTKLCAGKYQKFFGISHLRPTFRKHSSRMSPKSLVVEEKSTHLKRVYPSKRRVYPSKKSLPI